MYLALHGRDSAVQRGTAAVRKRKRARKAETGKKERERTRERERERERERVSDIYNLKREKITQRKWRNVASKLSETHKVKPVSTV